MLRVRLRLQRSLHNQTTVCLQLAKYRLVISSWVEGDAQKNLLAETLYCTDFPARFPFGDESA